MSTQQKALYLQSRLGKFALGTADIPTPGAGELLVEIHATALNPVDWKVRDHDVFSLVKEYPAILGLDSAGVVKAVGEGVTRFAVGDRVLHPGLYTNRRATFQQYTTVTEDFAAKIPENLSFDEAATIPLTATTAGLGLYKENTGPLPGAALSPPWEEGGRGKYAGQPFVLLGGSSSVGQQAIQFAKISGFSPILTTAATCHEEYLKSLGATNIIDRTILLSSLHDEVAKITKAPILLVFDAISEADTQNAAYDLVTPGGKLILVLPPQIDSAKRAGDKEIIPIVGNLLVPAQRAFVGRLFEHLAGLLEAGDIKPNNVEVLSGGLAAIPDGLQRLKEGISAKKLIVNPQETV